MSRKKRKNVILGIIGAVVIGIVVSVSYSSEQTRLKGFTFGNNLQEIQNDLKKIQTDFQSEITILEEGDISKEEFLDNSKKHISKMEKLIFRYDSLEPPRAFSSSVELFRFSANSQLESDIELIEWIENGDQSAKIRSDTLIQESFEYELAALAKFNAAKAGIEP